MDAVSVSFTKHMFWYGFLLAGQIQSGVSVNHCIVIWYRGYLCSQNVTHAIAYGKTCFTSNLHLGDTIRSITQSLQHAMISGISIYGLNITHVIIYGMGCLTSNFRLVKICNNFWTGSPSMSQNYTHQNLCSSAFVNSLSWSVTGNRAYIQKEMKMLRLRWK